VAIKDGPVGILFEGHAVPVPIEMVPAAIALAEAAKANAEAIATIARYLFQGTPGITNSSISGTSITQTPVKSRVRKRV
jgi:hypothetical protein